MPCSALGPRSLICVAQRLAANDTRIKLIGETFSTDLQVTPNAMLTTHPDGEDAGFLAIFDADLHPIYTTYLADSTIGAGHAVAAGSDGSVYIAFEADRSPSLPAGGGDVVMKLNPDGSVGFARRMFGMVNDLAVDRTGHLFVGGYPYGSLASFNAANIVGTSSRRAPTRRRTRSRSPFDDADVARPA